MDRCKPVASVSCLATCVERTEQRARIGYCPQIWVRQFGVVTRLGRGRGAAGAAFAAGCGSGTTDDVATGFEARPCALPSPTTTKGAQYAGCASCGAPISMSATIDR